MCRIWYQVIFPKRGEHENDHMIVLWISQSQSEQSHDRFINNKKAQTDLRVRTALSEAYLLTNIKYGRRWKKVQSCITGYIWQLDMLWFLLTLVGPRRDKTCLRGFRQSETQTRVSSSTKTAYKIKITRSKFREREWKRCWSVCANHRRQVFMAKAQLTYVSIGTNSVDRNHNAPTLYINSLIWVHSKSYCLF